MRMFSFFVHTASSVEIHKKADTKSRIILSNTALSVHLTTLCHAKAGVLKQCSHSMLQYSTSNSWEFDNSSEIQHTDL